MGRPRKSGVSQKTCLCVLLIAAFGIKSTGEIEAGATLFFSVSDFLPKVVYKIGKLFKNQFIYARIYIIVFSSCTWYNC